MGKGSANSSPTDAIQSSSRSDNTTLQNMDGVIGYSYTGIGNGVVVVIFGGL